MARRKSQVAFKISHISLRFMPTWNCRPYLCKPKFSPGKLLENIKCLSLEETSQEWDRKGWYCTCLVLQSNSGIREGRWEERRSSCQHAKWPPLGQDGNSRRDSRRQWHLARHLREKCQGCNPSRALGKASNQKTDQSISSTEPNLFSTWVYSPAEPSMPTQSVQQGSTGSDGLGESSWFPLAIEMGSVLKEISSPHTHSRASCWQH